MHRRTSVLQTERQFRNNYFEPGTDVSLLGICNLQSVSKSDDDRTLAKTRAFLTPWVPPGSFCKRVLAQPQTPRNADCLCGSGLKHKRCCGKDAPAVLDVA
jgi:hypothetical protein